MSSKLIILIKYIALCWGVTTHGTNVNLVTHASRAHGAYLAISITALLFCVAMYLRLIVKYFIKILRCGDQLAEPDLHITFFNVGLKPRPGDTPVLNRKIFRGLRVTIHEHPYIASIRRNYVHYSVAVILSENVLLSVAHPLNKVPINELGVVVGENYADRGTAVMTVVMVIIHPDFDSYTLNADLALIRTYENMVYKTSIKPVLGLWEPNVSVVNKKAFVTGWGRCDLTGKELCLSGSSKYYPDEKLDPMLKTISFHITDDMKTQCEFYKDLYDIYFHKGTVCLGLARQQDPVAPCMAVPGAPMVIEARLLGLQSWGYACGYKQDLPVIYTDIRMYYDWISYNVDILCNVTNTDLNSLFQATKAVILSEWLNKTRDLKYFNDYLDEDIQPLEIDKTLALLNGSIYDIRNYVNKGRYNEVKLKMYDIIRIMIDRAEKAIEIYNAVPKNKSEPFMKYDSDIMYSEMRTKSIEGVDNSSHGIEADDNDDVYDSDENTY